MLTALLGAWENGLVAGPTLLLVAYTISLTAEGQPLSRAAPLVAAGLVALIDIGSWSLELRDGAEERPFAHLWTLVPATLGAFAGSLLVLSTAGVVARGGIAMWVLGAAAAIGLFTLMSRHSESA